MTEYEIQLIENAKNIIIENKNKPFGMKVIIECMSSIYKYFKKVIPEATFSDKRLLEVFKLERLLDDAFLPLVSEPIYEENKTYEIPSSIVDENDCCNLMEYIVHESRTILNKHYDIRTSSLEKCCINSAIDVKKICERLGVDHTNYSCETDLSVGVFHCFNIVHLTLPDGTINNYLVDCTYRQFFIYADSFLERIGMPLNSGANIGAYMLMDESRKKFAEELLTKGYVELTEENIKHYFDGFVFTGRNGLYYESLNKTVLDKVDYEPHYTASDYIYALNNGGLQEEKFMGRQSDVLNKDIEFGNIDSIKNLENIGPKKI